jgi:hypothetical protein
MGPIEAERATPFAPRPRRVRKLAFAVVYAASVYLLFELLYGTLYVRGIISPPPSLWIFEDRGTIQFDPVRGYRLSDVPARWSRITYGEVEYLGILRGNAQGFPDDRDFTPRRAGAERRLAVFGDSFTAAQFFPRNWPAAVEERAAAEGEGLDLLNFSIDGGGLANWWSVLTQIVAAEGYELDGLVFAPIDSDLSRTFTVAEHRGQRRHMLGRARSWEPSEWPKTEEEARQVLLPTDGYLLSPEDFDAVLRGDLRPDIQRSWGFHGASALADLFFRAQHRVRAAFRGPTAAPRATAKPEARPVFEPAQQRLIEQIADVARERGLPVLVVRIPLREEALGGLPPSQRMLSFAELLGATFIDGNRAFAGLSESAIRSNWFPYDGHWSQVGSDRFAGFMLGVLQEWLADRSGKRGKVEEPSTRTAPRPAPSAGSPDPGLPRRP